jgi:hypothetical protein
MGSSSLAAIGKEIAAEWNMTTAGIGIGIGTSEIETVVSSRMRKAQPAVFLPPPALPLPDSRLIGCSGGL